MFGNNQMQQNSNFNGESQFSNSIAEMSQGSFGGFSQRGGYQRGGYSRGGRGQNRGFGGRGGNNRNREDNTIPNPDFNALNENNMINWMIDM